MPSRTVWICLLCIVASVTICAATLSITGFAQTTIPSEIQTKALVCAYGGVGFRPIPLPPDFDTEFAVVVVEIASSSSIPNVGVSEFSILSKDRSEVKMKHVVQVEEFLDIPSNDGRSPDSYIFNGATRPWNGTLPAGRILLRIRVALEHLPAAPLKFRLLLGNRVIEGEVAGEWPTV
jgi:hypothetical protein